MIVPRHSFRWKVAALQSGCPGAMNPKGLRRTWSRNCNITFWNLVSMCGWGIWRSVGFSFATVVTPSSCEVETKPPGRRWAAPVLSALECPVTALFMDCVLESGPNSKGSANSEMTETPLADPCERRRRAPLRKQDGYPGGSDPPVVGASVHLPE